MMEAGQLSTILDPICPMHLILDGKGDIVGAGPTLQKLRPEINWIGQSFLYVFDVRRPRSAKSMTDLRKMSGTKFHLEFRSEPKTSFKGLLVPLPEKSGAVVNLSFGISILDAVRDYELTGADFPATELAIEMLYLVEAKSAAMEASRQLNLRLQGARIAAEEQAFTDTLTGLKNRRAMTFVLERLITADADFALMHLDLDYFKAVNDTYGHAAGDVVLQHVAKTMVDLTRDDDTVARVGGDEFVLIFPGLSNRKRLDSLALRLIDRMERPIPFNGTTCRVSASIGLTFSGPGKTEAELLEEADMALYAAKRAGRSCHRFFDGKDGAASTAKPRRAVSGGTARA